MITIFLRSLKWAFAKLVQFNRSLSLAKLRKSSQVFETLRTRYLQAIVNYFFEPLSLSLFQLYINFESIVFFELDCSSDNISRGLVEACSRKWRAFNEDRNLLTTASLDNWPLSSKVLRCPMIYSFANLT